MGPVFEIAVAAGFVNGRCVVYSTAPYIGELVSEARLTESSSSGSDMDSTEQHQPPGMNHGIPSRSSYQTCKEAS